MKAFPIAKILTGVTLLLFTSLSWGQGKTREQCNQACDKQARESFTKPDTSDPEYSRKLSEYNQNITSAKTTCIENDKCNDIDSSRDIKQSCTAAFDKYSEAATKMTEACNAFDKKGGGNCKTKAESCRKKLDNLMDGVEDEDTADTLESMANTFLGNQKTTDSTNICVKSIDRKARAQDKKDKDRERKDLSDKIKQQRDKIVEYKEDLDKEKNENAKETAELEAENKKDVLAKEKQISDETSKVSKEIVEIGKRMRGYSLAITKETQNLANANFEYQTAMLEFTSEKINQRCQQEFQSLKASIVNASVGGAPAGASAEEQKQYAALAALAAQYKSQGIKGSGSLKTMLASARKACFERANVSMSKNRMANSQTVKNIQDKIDEYKNTMNDEKNAIATAQKNIETLKSQIDKEKSQAESEKLTKLDNLSTKLSNQITSTNEKLTNANNKIEELKAEIQNLTLVQNFEVEDSYSEAIEAIEKGKLARERAYEDCNCVANTTSSQCSVLATDKQNYDGTKPKSTTKSKR